MQASWTRISRFGSWVEGGAPAPVDDPWREDAEIRLVGAGGGSGAPAGTRELGLELFTGS